MFYILSHLGNANQNNPDTCQSEYLRPKIQMTANAGENVEKEEHFCIVGVIANWSNHSEYQSGGSSEN